MIPVHTSGYARKLLSMAGTYRLDIGYLFGFFIILTLLGSLLLMLPAASAQGGTLAPLDAVFTAVSAVCVTGLTTIPLTSFSRFGQLVVLALIQLGGLGIISFSTLLVILPGMKMSLSRVQYVNNYYLPEVEYRPREIVRSIVLLTLLIELIGFLLLWGQFALAGVGADGSAAAGSASLAFNALFHSVSAFCNAGFSLYSESMEAFGHNPGVLLTITLLFVLGGLSFLVMHELAGQLLGRKKRAGRGFPKKNAKPPRYVLSVHSQLVLISTVFLLLVGMLVFLLLEWNGAFAGFGWGDKIMQAAFQSATPRTAGFNSVAQSDLQPASILLTMLFMLIGAAPGSIAGGIKVTTFAVVAMTVVRRIGSRGQLTVRHRELQSRTLLNASIFLFRALVLLFFAVFFLAMSESRALESGAFSLLEVVFESVSAFGTVGLSLGITPHLSIAGKIIIMATMFAGRLGLVSLAVPLFRSWFDSYASDSVRYPNGEVLLG